jgi:hypothetical protein
MSHNRTPTAVYFIMGFAAFGFTLCISLMVFLWSLVDLSKGNTPKGLSQEEAIATKNVAPMPLMNLFNNGFGPITVKLGFATMTPDDLNQVIQDMGKEFKKVTGEDQPPSSVVLPELLNQGLVLPSENNTYLVSRWLLVKAGRMTEAEALKEKEQDNPVRLKIEAPVNLDKQA